jgi:hypothetical protein
MILQIQAAEQKQDRVNGLLCSFNDPYRYIAPEPWSVKSSLLRELKVSIKVSGAEDSCDCLDPKQASDL